jgi:predicted nucleic acid-binding protein
VDVFFDTTVLGAASVQSHPHYAQARPALLRVAVGQDKGFMGQHSITEVFAALTRLPVRPRISEHVKAPLAIEACLADHARNLSSSCGPWWW